MYDFNMLFEEYIHGIGHVCEDEFAEIYEEWLNKYDEKIGDSPAGIIYKMSDGELIEQLKNECAIGAPSFAVMENIEKREPRELLEKLLFDDDGNVVYCAAELLRNIGNPPLELFVELLDTEDDELFELLVSALKEDPDCVREALLNKAEVSVKTKTAVAEILACGGKDERVFTLLTELFASGDNVPLYAGYLARYGDERAAAQLYRALDTAGYADYIEIRNAIESLGGVVDEYRDFSSDPEYIALKEKKYGK